MFWFNILPTVQVILPPSLPPSLPLSPSPSLSLYSPLQALKVLMSRELPAPVANHCSPEVVLRLSMAQADLCTALASTCTTLSPPNILTRSSGSSLARPPIHLFSPTPTPVPSQPSSETNLVVPCSPSLPHSTKLSRAAASRRLNEPHHVKMLLVEHAERLLVGVCHSLPSPSLELRVRTLLSLARLSLCLQHSSTAIQLSLAALRVMQAATAGGSHRLWLESRRSLAESLVGRSTGGVGGRRGVSGGDVMECAVQCEEGVKEAERFGDLELAAEFRFVAALHALSLSPPDTQTIMTQAQVLVPTDYSYTIYMYMYSQ